MHVRQVSIVAVDHEPDFLQQGEPILNLQAKIMANASCSIVAQLAFTSVKAWLHIATRRSLR